MKCFLILLFSVSVFCVQTGHVDKDINYMLDDLFSVIKTALDGDLDEHQTRQHQNYYKPNHGISLGIYEALRTITRNDELECIPRLLCEAAAGGQPGFSGRQIKFDVTSLKKFISYLQFDSSSLSPLLVFGKAALLGATNRGDPYSCIINYPKCPKDQSRLLYYLNNHRGGFFQYFGNNYHTPGNYHYQNQYQYQNYQNQYRPGYYYQNKFKRNQIQFESPNGLYEKMKKKAKSEFYAKKYSHSSLKFPEDRYKDDRYKRHKNDKPMVFPDDRIDLQNPRILTKGIRTPSEKKEFQFPSPNRNSKRLNDLNFFPQKNEPARQPAPYVTDRLPKRFNFPSEDSSTRYTKYPGTLHSSNSFFPES